MNNKNSTSLNNDAELINKNLIGIYKYFGIQKTQIAGANYYLLNTGYNYPLWNMIILPNSVTSEAINEMEQVFKTQNLPFAWWVEEKNLSKYMINHFESREYNYIDDVSGMIK